MLEFQDFHRRVSVMEGDGVPDYFCHRCGGEGVPEKSNETGKKHIRVKHRPGCTLKVQIRNRFPILDAMLRQQDR